MSAGGRALEWGRGAHGHRVSRMARVQLFATCLGDLIFPDAVADAEALLARGRLRGRLSRGAGLLWTARLQLGPSRGGAAGGAHLRQGVLALAAGRLPIGLVRDDGGALPAGAARRGAVRGLGALRVPRRPWGSRASDERGQAGRLPRLVPHAARAAASRTRLAACSSAPGAKLVPLPRPDLCCGFGGTFSVRQPEVSLAMADDKLAGAAAARCARHRRSGLPHAPPRPRRARGARRPRRPSRHRACPRSRRMSSLASRRRAALPRDRAG